MLPRPAVFQTFFVHSFFWPVTVLITDTLAAADAVALISVLIETRISGIQGCFVFFHLSSEIFRAYGRGIGCFGLLLLSSF